MRANTKEVYRNICLLLSFLDDGDPRVVADVQSQLKELSPKYLPVLKEILFDMDFDNDKTMRTFNDIVRHVELKGVEKNILLWAINHSELFVPFDIMAGINKNRTKASSNEKFHNLGFELFVEINSEDSIAAALETLSLRIANYFNNSQYLKTEAVNYIRKHLPPWIASDYVCATPYLTFAKRFDIPLTALKTEENFVLALQNSGNYKLGFIEDPFLAVIMPEEDGRADIISFKEAIETSLLKDVEVLDNKALFTLFVEKLMLHYNGAKNDVFFQWLQSLKHKLDAIKT